MSILSLLLILVLPTDALVSCPCRIGFQGSCRGVMRSSSCLPHKAIPPSSNWDGGYVDRGIGWKNLDHSRIEQMMAHQKDAVVDAFSTGFVASAIELPTESELRELFSAVLRRLEQNPEMITIGAVALVVVLLFTLNNAAASKKSPPSLENSVKGQERIMTPPPVNGEGHSTAVDLEKAVAGLSQSVVVLTNEIKAIKDSTEQLPAGTQKLVELQRQNEELQRELETTKVKAQTLTETHVSAQLLRVKMNRRSPPPPPPPPPPFLMDQTVLSNLGVQESSIIGKEQTSLEEEVNTHDQAEVFFVDEKENDASRNVNGEGKKDVSDLFLIAMGLGFLLTVFAGN